jgi:hypothetical protein
MSDVAPKLCPYCSAPLRQRTTSVRGVAKAHYACGTTLGFFRLLRLPVRSEDCRRNERAAKPHQGQ